MNAIEHSLLENVRRLSSPRVGIVIIFLIVLQFGLFPWISSVLRLDPDYNKYADYSYFYVISSYTLIVVGIVAFNINGLRLFSDHFSLWFIVLSCFFRFSLGGDHALIYRFCMALLGILLSLHVLTNQEKVNLPSLKLVLGGVLWSFVTVVVIAFLQFLLTPAYPRIVLPDLSAALYNTFLFNISFVTVIEEACFRGLIVGFMILNGYKENTAFFIQAVLFWIGHYYVAATNPVLFFVALPILTLSTTLIVKKYKVIFLSILVHTCVNIFTSIIVFNLQRFFW